MDKETTKPKKSKIDELSEQYDRIYKNSTESDSMFDFDIVAPYSDARTPPPPPGWHKGNMVTSKRKKFK